MKFFHGQSSSAISRLRGQALAECKNNALEALILIEHVKASIEQDIGQKLSTASIGDPETMTEADVMDLVDRVFTER